MRTMPDLATLAIGAVVVLTQPVIATDGDSLSTPEGAVRIWVASAPECPGRYGTRKRPCDDYPTAFLAALIADHEVTCVKRGMSGTRAVMQCAAGGRDLASEMLQPGGTSCAMTGFDPTRVYWWAPVCE
jgi:endonuclease YncB( thermonuclease family)